MVESSSYLLIFLHRASLPTFMPKKMRPSNILLYLILSIFVLSYAQNVAKPDFKIKIEYQAGIGLISNPEKPILGERRFNFIGKRMIDKNFNYVYVDLDANQNLFILDILEKKIFKFTKEGFINSRLKVTG